MHAASTRVVVGLALLLACGSPAIALNVTLDIDQYAHNTWTIRQGFFTGPALSLAQTPDGYLWVGTESGLFRFDGVRTVRWQPRGDERLPHETIPKLLVSRDGRLWIGTLEGLASWKDNRLVTYPELSGQVVDALAEDSQGTVWVGTIGVPTARLCAIGTTVRCTGNDGRLGNGVFSLLVDRGTVWVGAATGLWRWTPEHPTRYVTPFIADLLRPTSGGLVLATPDGIAELVGERIEPYRTLGVSQRLDSKRLLVDRDGGIWIGTTRAGLLRLHQGRVDVFTTAQGLSGDAISALFEDREGNIWVATNEGLDRFRELPVALMSKRQGFAADVGFSVLSARDGSIWVGSGNGVTRWSNGQTTIYRTASGLPDNRVGTLFQDSRGRILAATLSGLATFTDGRFSRVPSTLPTRVIYNIVEDRSGNFWMTEQDQGLIHMTGDDVITRTPWAALGRVDHGTAMVEDRTRAGLWIGFYKGGVAFVKDGAVRASYGPADGLGVGRVSELQIDADGTLWAATAGGLSRISGQGIATLTSRNGLPCDSAHWMVTDRDRARWLMLSCGLARISYSEWARWLADSSRSIKSVVFTSTDGVRSQSSPIGFTPSAARLPNGRLWFASPNGIAVIDPAHLANNGVAPAAAIEQIVADRITYDRTTDSGAAVRLPARTDDVQLDYTALSLAAPEKVQFRYRLDGRDKDWQEVGNRRQAFYTDLGPGQYRFRVTAADSTGGWSDTAAMLDFSIAPAYYQTTWFLALSAGLIAALVWSAHRIRVRILETHEREISALNERLMKAQEQERIRIAGELHDGVMQQMLAAIMMLGTAKRRIANNPDAAATIDKVQNKLIQAGTDIRQLSHELHPPVLQEAGLPKALQIYCEDFSTTCGIPVTCEVDQPVEELSRGAALALFRIVQEALGNAVKHGQPKNIHVQLSRTAEMVSLIIGDDGVGFDPGWLGTRPMGGLGLVTMRERATQLNGTFEFDSAPGRGTTISVTIPFR
jgi:signal transduction histidine kinase/ligand-binding sensor domain-containing protein